MSQPNAKTPIFISLAFVIVGVILGVLGSAILGGVIAACGIIPAVWGAWAGMQQETQASLAGALGMVFVSLGVGGVLVLLGIINVIR